MSSMKLVQKFNDKSQISPYLNHMEYGGTDTINNQLCLR